MKTIILCLVCVISTATFAHSFDIKAHCREVSEFAGGSYQIEESCRQMENESKKNIAKMSVPARIMKHCTEVAEYAGGSYQILESCIKMEQEAKSRLD